MSLETFARNWRHLLNFSKQYGKLVQAKISTSTVYVAIRSVTYATQPICQSLLVFMEWISILKQLSTQLTNQTFQHLLLAGILWIQS